MCRSYKAEAGFGASNERRDENVNYRTSLQAVSLLRWMGMVVCLFLVAKVLLWLAAPFVFLWLV